MPRCRWIIRLNPSDQFAEHAMAVRDKLQRAEVLAADTTVNVVYGYGPSAEATFVVDELDDATTARLIRVAEELRTNGDTRAEVLLTEVWLTAEERDRMQQGEGGTPRAYNTQT